MRSIACMSASERPGASCRALAGAAPARQAARVATASSARRRDTGQRSAVARNRCTQSRCRPYERPARSLPGAVRRVAVVLAALAVAAPAARAADDPLLAPPDACPAATDPDAPHHDQRVAMHCLVNLARARA